jgi:hypothetical protein
MKHILTITRKENPFKTSEKRKILSSVPKINILRAGNDYKLALVTSIDEPYHYYLLNVTSTSFTNLITL